MATKQFLLDLIEEKERAIRFGTDREASKMLDEFSTTNMAAWKQLKLADLDRARRLVENGPEEL